ncbi:MAG: hypothetical protein WCO48_01470 [Candidatus Taylorbacteria bacterium]
MDNNTMLVDPTKGFKTLLAECANNWFDDDITEKRFPITAEDGGEWEYNLWDPKGSVSSPDAIERMKGDDANNPWMPARLAHLLVFGKLNPDAQRSNPIIALGSVGRVYVFRHVPYLFGGSSARGLNLSWWDNDWNSNYRFLAVRYYQRFSCGLSAGVLFISCLFQPPSIFPISAKFSDKVIYLLLSIAFISQASCRRSLIRSTLTILIFICGCFSATFV